jgi:hypothetical protein
MIDISIILSHKLPNAQWSLNGDDYEGLTWYSTDIQKPTQKEIESWNKEVQIQINKDNCETKAKDLIANCDWSVLPDVNLQNKSEFENYRSILRNLILNPVENPVFPIEPDPIWSK